MIADFDRLIAAISTELPGLAGKTFALANYVPGDQIVVVADPEDGASVLFQDLELQIDPEILAVADDISGRAQLSLEQIGLLDADLLVIFSNGADPSDLVGYDQLRPVVNGSAIELDYSAVVGLNADTAIDRVLARPDPARPRGARSRVMTETRDESVDAAIAALEPLALNRMNADFEDSVLPVGRVLGGRPDAHPRSHRVDRSPGRALRRRRLERGASRTDRVHGADHIADALQDELMGLVLRARAHSGEEGTTTAEREIAEAAKVRTFVTEVSAVERVHPHLRRITLAGGELASFRPVGPDSFVYVLLPPPGRTELTIDQQFTWTHYEEMPEADRPVGAYYTVRHWRPETSELSLLFVLHGDVGPASGWASRARPGDPLALWGPRTAYHPPARHRLVPARRRRDWPAGGGGHPRIPS